MDAAHHIRYAYIQILYTVKSPLVTGAIKKCSFQCRYYPRAAIVLLETLPSIRDKARFRVKSCQVGVKLTLEITQYMLPFPFSLTTHCETEGGRTDGRTDRQTDGQTDTQTDGHFTKADNFQWPLLIAILRYAYGNRSAVLSM